MILGSCVERKMRGNPNPIDDAIRANNDFFSVLRS